MTQSKTLVMPDFWVPNSRFPNCNLYSGQIGWTTELKVESGGYADLKEIWEHLTAFPGKELVGFDLGYLYLEETHLSLTTRARYGIHSKSTERACTQPFCPISWHVKLMRMQS